MPRYSPDEEAKFKRLWDDKEKYKGIVERVDSLMAELGIENLEFFCATAFQYKKVFDNIMERWEDFYKTTGGLESHDIHIRDFILQVMGWKDDNI